MKFNTGIYQIVNLINGKRYIGSAVNFRKREQEHFSTLKNNKHPNKHLNASFSKYGKENFKFEIIMNCFKEDLLFFEQKHIDKYDFDNLYNIRKIAESNLGVKKSKESIAKTVKANKGKKLSKEHIEKIKKGNTGKKMSSESIEKGASKRRGENNVNYGKSLPFETRKKMSEAKKGKRNHFYGKKHSDKSKQRISQSKKGKKLSIETRRKLSKIRKGKISNIINFDNNEINIIKTMKCNGKSITYIAKHFKCSRTPIRRILSQFHSKGSV